MSAESHNVALLAGATAIYVDIHMVFGHGGEHRRLVAKYFRLQAEEFLLPGIVVELGGAGNVYVVSLLETTGCRGGLVSNSKYMNQSFYVPLSLLELLSKYSTNFSGTRLLVITTVGRTWKRRVSTTSMPAVTMSSWRYKALSTTT